MSFINFIISINYFNFLFFIFAFIILSCALMVIGSKNPIHSILYLVLVFCSSSGILLMLEVDFLAMMFIVVYVGAIAVLFLFVIMMLNIKIIELNENLISYLPISAFLMVIFILEFFIFLDSNFWFNNASMVNYTNWMDIYLQKSNIVLIGNLIYTWYFPLFTIVGLILLVAMIGPIVLTLNHTKYVLRQSIFQQNLRDWKKTISSRK